MAIQDRVHSLETEYAISFYADDGSKGPNAGAIVDALSQALSEGHGLPNTPYLVNGSQLAHDVGHAEWSQPECRTGREVAIYDKAADHLLHRIVPRAQQMFEAQGMRGRLVVTKNNADNFGHTYGCHENYQMLRDADLLVQDDFVRYMAHTMIPFLVSRQLLVGSGRLVTGRAARGADLRYELSQRAGFIRTAVSRDTTKERPIFNLGREGESFSTGNFRRLHPILGDANLSGWATWIKMGSTGLLLRLIEDVFIDSPPALKDPVAALHAICKDVTGQVRVALQDGREVTAVDLQWEYYDQVDGYLNLFGATEDDEKLMEEWGRALEDCEQDSMRLRDRADWAIKKQVLDSFLQQHGYSFEQPPTARDVLTDLQALDLRFHEVSANGVYSQLFPIDTAITEDEIRYAQEYPPPHTRARIRGTAIRLGRELGLNVHTGGWMEVSIEDSRLSMADPMEFDHRALLQWQQTPWEAVSVPDEVDEDDEENPFRSRRRDRHESLYKRGMCYRQYGRHQAALAAFQEAVEAREVRRVVRALAEQQLLVGRYTDALATFELYNSKVQDERRDDDFYQAFAIEHIGPGDAQRFLGNADAAETLYREAYASKAATAALARRNVGLLALRRGDLDAAMAAFDESVRLTDERVVSWVASGAIQLKRGETDAARQLFEQVLALPEHRVCLGLTEPALAYFVAVARLGLEQPRALEALRAALSHRAADAANGLYALEALLTLLAEAPQIPPEAQAALELARGVEVLLDQPDDDSAGCTNLEVVRWLAAALEHTNPRVRRKAAEYMGWRMAEGYSALVERLYPLLLAHAKRDADAQVRREAILALGQSRMAQPGLVDELIRCLHDHDPVVRWAAQDSLERVSRPAAASGVTELVATVAGRRLAVEEE